MENYILMGLTILLTCANTQVFTITVDPKVRELILDQCKSVMSVDFQSTNAIYFLPAGLKS